MVSKLSILAGATVALVILIDLVTGQGPPALNAYFGQGPPREYLQQLPPPPPPFQPIGYMPRGEYDRESYVEKPKEIIEKEKEREKELAKEYEKDGKDLSKSSPAPGMFSSMSNSMSDAWKSLTSLGRQTRSVRDIRSVTDSEKKSQADGKTANSKARSLDEYESRQYSNQGYVFFKIPRNLVCSKAA